MKAAWGGHAGLCDWLLGPEPGPALGDRPAAAVGPGPGRDDGGGADRVNRFTTLADWLD